MSEHSRVFLDHLTGRFLDHSAFRLSGEIDVAVARAAETDFVVAALFTSGSSITIDCAQMTSIDSSGIHMLEHVAERTGKSVHLVNLPRPCRRLFEALDLCETFGMETAHPEPLARSHPSPGSRPVQ